MEPAFVSTFVPGVSGSRLRVQHAHLLPLSRLPRASMTDPNNNNKTGNGSLVVRAGRAAAAAALAALLTLPINPAIALSGGRVGGRSFRSAPAPTRSIPRGGYGGSYRGGFGYGGGIYAPIYTPPIFSPTFGYGYGYSLGGGVGTLLLAGGALALVSRMSSSDTDEISSSSSVSTAVSVVALKVAVLSTAAPLRRELSRIANTADTNSPRGLAIALQDAAVALLRAREYWAYAAVADAPPGMPSSSLDAERQFGAMAARERAKVERETVVNVQGERRRDLDSTADSTGEYVIVTILAAANRSAVRGFPRRITSIPQVEQALQTLAGVPADGVQALELLWAPATEYGGVSVRELTMDHPELRQL